jgi:hypothetical protein
MEYLQRYIQEQMLKNDKEKNLLIVMKKFSSTKERQTTMSQEICGNKRGVL